MAASSLVVYLFVGNLLSAVLLWGGWGEKPAIACTHESLSCGLDSRWLFQGPTFAGGHADIAVHVLRGLWSRWIRGQGEPDGKVSARAATRSLSCVVDINLPSRTMDAERRSELSGGDLRWVPRFVRPTV